MSDLINKAHRLFDEKLLRTRQTYAAAGRPVVFSCTKGCFACCVEPVYTSKNEAEHVISSIPPEELEGVKRRTQEWVDKAVASGILQEATPNVYRYRPLKLWCPLLKDGQCLVYKNRPLGCRGHNALGPQEWCGDDKLRKKQRFANMPHIVNEAFMVIVSEGPDIHCDNLVVFMAEALLGIKVESSSEIKVKLPNSLGHDDEHQPAVTSADSHAD